MFNRFPSPFSSGIFYIQSLWNTFQATPRHVQHPSQLPRVSVSSRCKLCGTASRTTLIQTFVNPSRTDIIPTATYTFPLYESCAVVAFRYSVGNSTFDGVVQETEAAKEQYDRAVAQGRTAGLLEQSTPHIFSAALGNIPAGATVVVEIEYIMELKHDAQVDGLRFTIPVSIASRSTTDTMPIAHNTILRERKGMDISVQVTMPSRIRFIHSPSHTVSVHIGSHSENDDESYNPNHALVSFLQPSAELHADFVLFVKCADLGTPQALLETHSTLLKSMALMVTLVPKFQLPPIPMPEIVFLVDCCPHPNDINTLITTLSTFLQHLPNRLKFNLCTLKSNGSSFLWNKSQPKTSQSLKHAQHYIENMELTIVGTTILPSIQTIVSMRRKDLMLEVVLLTSALYPDFDDVSQYLRNLTSKGDIRFFCVGIGDYTTHSHVEGVARAGKGFSQIITNNTESIDRKIGRILRAMLSAHIQDYRIEWAGRPIGDETNMIVESKSISIPSDVKTRRKISLFDPNADLDTPIAVIQDYDSKPHERLVPSIIQAPHEFLPLFPFSRSTVYVILSGNIIAPPSVWVRATTPSGDDLELEIKVEPLLEKGKTIHQLAARKVLQELEDGTGFFHSAEYDFGREKGTSAFAEHVAHLGTHLGARYGVASKWTSFVAVERKGTATGAAISERPIDLLLDPVRSMRRNISAGVGDDQEHTIPSVSMFKDIQQLSFNNSVVNFINHGDQHNVRQDTGRGPPLEVSNSELPAQSLPLSLHSASDTCYATSRAPTSSRQSHFRGWSSFDTSPFLYERSARSRPMSFHEPSSSHESFPIPNESGTTRARTASDTSPPLTPSLVEITPQSMASHTTSRDSEESSIWRTQQVRGPPIQATRSTIHKDSSNTILAGTFSELVEELIRVTVAHSTISRSGSASYRQIFLTTYIAYTSEERLIQCLTDKFEEAVSSHDIQRAKGIISGMIYWLSLPQVRFDIEILEEMDSLVGRWPPEYTKELIGDIKKAKEGLTLTPRSPSIPSSHSAPKHTEDQLVAEALTALEARNYQQLVAADYINHVVSPPNTWVTNALSFNKRVSHLVKATILESSNLEYRSRTFAWFLRIANRCLKLHNLSSAAVIIRALRSSYIARLKETVDSRMLDKQFRRQWSRLCELTDEQQYKSIERIEPCMPRIDVILADVQNLLAKNSATIDIAGQTLINFRLCHKLAESILKPPYQNEHHLSQEPGLTQWLEQRLLGIDISDGAELRFDQRSRELEIEEDRLRRNKLMGSFKLASD